MKHSTKALRLGLLLLLLSAAVLLVMVPLGRADDNPPAGNTQEGWDFKQKGFVIGAWWGPGANEAEMKVYAEAGFDLVMTGRYMQLESYADADSVLRQMDLAGKYDLGVLLDTYTKDDRPWGGLGDIPTTRGHHHPASLPELKWLHERVGEHPALVGYMLGDDQGTVDARLAQSTAFLKKEAPHLFPWICGWITAADLAAHDNPILDHQIYPTLYQWSTTAEHQRDEYLRTYAIQRVERRDLGMLVWPMINTCLHSENKPDEDMFAPCPSDSLVRLPIYATVAYGFDGLMYFTYNGGALCHVGTHDTEEKARAAVTPLYDVVQEANLRLRSWAPRLVDLRSEGLIANLADTPVNGNELAEFSDARSIARPAPWKIVQQLDDDVLVGILSKEGQPTLAMVVDLRVGKEWAEVPARETEIAFHPAVESLRVLETTPRDVEGSTVSLTLRGGEGMLLELHGEAEGIAAVSRTPTLYGDVPPLIRASHAIFVDTLPVEIVAADPAAVIRYTLDGTPPSRDAARYEGAFTLCDTTTVTACVEVEDGLSAPAIAIFRKVKPRTCARPEFTEKGLTWTLYDAPEEGWDKLPDFGGLVPAARGRACELDLGVACREEGFGLVFEGYLLVRRTGVYTFRITSDDGSRLEICGKVVADHDGLHGMAAKGATGEVALKQGLHAFRVLYFEKSGDEGLLLECAGPGFEMQKVPVSAYRREL